MDIPYTVVYSSRKTLAVRITKEGEVEVLAPKRTPKRQIEQIVADNEALILRHVERLSALAKKRQSFTVSIGSRILYLGREYEIRGVNGNKVGFDSEGFYAPNDIEDESLRASLKRLYRLLASNYIKELVEKESACLSLTPKSVKINSAKTRWGSCGAGNTLNFSWRLIMADEQAVRYVVLHELVHMYEHNHSNSFWRKLESIVPDYKSCEKRLDLLSARLAGENWD